MMSQHIDNTVFNVVRFAIAAGCQRVIIFGMYYRCRVALPEKSSSLNVYCVQYFVDSVLYFVFAICMGLAHANTPPYEEFDQAHYVGILPSIEIVIGFSFLVAPYLMSRRLPLDVPYVINRFGEMMLICIGEVSFALTQCAAAACSIIQSQLELGPYRVPDPRSTLILWYDALALSSTSPKF